MGRKKCDLHNAETFCFSCHSFTDGRFIFFTKTEDDLQLSAFETLAKSDRRAIQSVASVLRLHLDKEDEEDDTILDVIIDREQGM